MKIFLIWLPIFLGGFIIVSVCLGRIAVQNGLKTEEQWFPNYSILLLRENETLLRSELDEAQAQKIKVNAVEILRRSPLSDHPFSQVGKANIVLDESNHSRNLFVEALNRNVRNRRALRALVNIAVSQEDYDIAIDNLDALLSLNASESQLVDYHNTLQYLSENDGAKIIIDDYLAKQPIWGTKFLNNKIRTMTEANFENVGRSIGVFTNGRAQNRSVNQLNGYYIQTLKRMRKVEAAFDYWYSLLEDPKPKLNYTVFNANFKNRNELPPFNWLEVDTQKFFSEIDQDGGLYASYGDSGVKTLTEQLLKLSPGKIYRLDVNAEWSYRRRQGMFFWVLTCIPSDAVISGVNLDDQAKKSSGGQHDFQVPLQGCEFQNLRLLAKSGQYSQRIWSKTNFVNIDLLE